MRTAICVLLVAIGCTANAQGLKSATKTLTAGNWTVLRDVDPMTDKVGCTGVYKNDLGVQLSDEGFYFRVLGGIEGVTLRFNDEPARPMRLGTNIEKKIRSVILDGTDFAAVLEANRLRYSVTTLVSGIKQGDFDLTGIRQAYDHIKAGCPLPGKA